MSNIKSFAENQNRSQRQSSSLVRDYCLSNVPVPTAAYVTGAVLCCLLFVMGQFNNAQLQNTRLFGSISSVVDFATGFICFGYVGALLLGCFVMLLDPTKPKEFWKEQFPAAFLLWIVGLSCCFLFLLCGLHIKQFVSAPDIVDRLRPEVSSGRLPFCLALVLFSIRTGWYSLVFRLPWLSFSQYVIFYMTFLSLLYHHRFQPLPEHPGGPPGWPALSSFALLLLVRKWRLVEGLWQGKLSPVNRFDAFLLIVGNTIVTASVCWGLYFDSSPRSAGVFMACLRVFLCLVTIAFYLISVVGIVAARIRSRELSERGSCR